MLVSSQAQVCLDSVVMSPDELQAGVSRLPCVVDSNLLKGAGPDPRALHRPSCLGAREV